jgi:lysophospholipase L1-like esterase
MTAFGRADGWHPNNAGHAAIAGAVLQAMGIAQDQP